MVLIALFLLGLHLRKEHGLSKINFSCVISFHLGSPLMHTILWKLSSIQMKILNDISCNLIWIKFQFQFNSKLDFLNAFTNWIEIQLNWNGMQIGGEGIENIIITILWCWRKKLKKTHFHASLLGNGLDRF